MRLSTTEQRFKVCSDAIKPYADKLSLINAYFNMLKQDSDIEGYVQYPYLDTRGVLTIGLGHRIYHPEKSYDWLKGQCDNSTCNETNAKLATADEVRSYFNKLNSLKNIAEGSSHGFLPSYFINAEGEYDYSLFLSKSDIEKLFSQDSIDKIKGLKNNFHHIFDYPRPVQITLLDFMYNFGVGGFMWEMPKFINCVRQAMKSLVVDKPANFKQVSHYLEKSFLELPKKGSPLRSQRRKMWLQDTINALDKKGCQS